MWHRFLLVMMAIGFLVSVSACNTVAGFGRDVEKVGEKIHDKAKK